MINRKMKISCFTFLRNANILGYPFIESIKSVLPLCDEYIVNVGDSEDNTLEMVKSIGDPKIRVIQSQWNEAMKRKGYVYGQQKMIALFNCTGDWAFYLEADEVIHEDDLPKIREAMQKYLRNDGVEALVFDYIHFYGNHKTYAWSHAWYRREARVIKNSIRSFAPDGLFFVVLESNKKGRYPRAALADATVYHYGWVRSEKQMNEKLKKVGKYWGATHADIDYSQIDSSILKEFKGTHPKVMKDWLPKDVKSIFKADTNHVLTKREKRHRLALKLEKMFRLDLSKKHFKLKKEP
ncbi:glycosyltransferase [Thermodesulfovibrionales bacterium]|nr:glycosyltransferase [Thermodesulfovibrionales bacterium]